MVEHLVTQTSHLTRQLVGPGRRLAPPERDAWRRSAGVLDSHHARAKPLHAPAGAPQQEDVPTVHLHREVLVERADLAAVGLGHHRVGEGVGDRAAVHQRSEPRPLPRPEQVVHPIAVQMDAHPPAPLAHALGEHLEDLRVPLPGQVTVGPGPPQQRVQRPLVPGVHRAGSDDLLGEHVQRRLGHPHRVELAIVNRTEERGALHQLVPGQCEEDAFAHPVQRVPRAPHPLQEERDAPRAPKLHHQVHGADVDSQFERGGGHHRPQLAPLELLLGRESQLPCHAPVVCRDCTRAESRPEVMGHALGQLPGVGEDERRPVLGGELHQPVVDLSPHLVGRDRAQRVLGRLERQLPLAKVSHLDHCASLRSSGEEGGEGLHRLLRGRQPDQLGTAPHLRLQPLEREREMTAPLVPRQGVDLVDDDRVHVTERLASTRGGEHQVQRLRRGDEDVRGPAEHLGPLARGRVPGPDLDPDRLGEEAFPRGEVVDGLERSERGSSGRRSPAPSAARRRPPTSGPRAGSRARVGEADPAPPGTPRASFPSRWAQR